MIHVRRALATLVTAPVLLVLPALSACGGEPHAVADPPTVLPSSPATTPQPPKRETAEHFIRRWADEGTHMQNSGKTKAYLSLSQDCQGCDASARLISKIYQAGGSVSWSGWRIRRVVEMPRKGFRFIDLYVTSAPTTYRPTRHSPVRRLTGGRVHYQVQVERHATTWFVTSFTEIAS